MQRKHTSLLMGILGSCLMVMGQNVKPRLNDLPLHNLDAFSTGGNQWKIVGAAQANYTDTLLQTSSGMGILLNDFNYATHYRTAAPIQTKMEHGDLIFEFDFMIPKGGRSRVFLQSRYGIQIADSWNIKLPKSNDMGGIYERGEKGNGFFISKIFMGGTFNEIVAEGKKYFKEVKVFKPKSSRKESKESFIICKNLR